MTKSNSIISPKPAERPFDIMPPVRRKLNANPLEAELMEALSPRLVKGFLKVVKDKSLARAVFCPY